jgi:hypothetical protein
VTDKFTAHRALEALRAGVPSRSLVERLGTDQGLISSRFDQLICDLKVSGASGDALTGFFIRGRFGSGKSHLVKYFEKRALEAGLACSTIAISKEVRLSDRHDLFKAAANNLRLPDRPRGGLREAALKLRFDSNEYQELVNYLQAPKCEVEALFRVSLLLFERSSSDDLEDQLISFWSGSNIKMSELRREAVRHRIDLRGLYQRSAQGIAMQRFAFAAALLRAAGYGGWLLFVDEVELLAKYSPKLRLQSYVNVANLLALGDERIPGFAAIMAVTPDLDGVLTYQCHDPSDWYKYSVKWDSLLPPARIGLEALSAKELQVSIAQSLPERFSTIRETVKALYEECYAGEHTDLLPECTASQNMRTFLRSLVTRYDLRRIDTAYTPDLESIELQENLAQDEDFGGSGAPASEEASVE